MTWIAWSWVLWADARLLIIVVLAGALGASIHALRSLSWYVGNRQLLWSWLATYLALPVVGALLAAAFYLLLRGGLYTAGSGVQAANPFSFAAIGVLVGMFSTQASLKLKEIADTVLVKPQSGADHAPSQSGGAVAGPKAPAVTTVERQDRAAGAAQDALLIKGSGFAQGAVVRVNDAPRPATVQTADAVLLPLTDADVKTITGGGDFRIVVVNPNGAVSPTFDYAA